MVFRDIYEQEAYDRACDFCADFSFEDGTLRKTRIQLPVERFCRYASLLDKDIENTGIRFSLSFNLEISNSYKDKSYDEFKSHVNKMAREWLENAIRELEGEGDAVYHFNPDTLFDRREIRDLFLAPYSKEGSGRALKMVLRDLYYCPTGQLPLCCSEGYSRPPCQIRRGRRNTQDGRGNGSCRQCQ